MPQDVDFAIPFPARVSSDIGPARERSLSWARRMELVVHAVDEQRFLAWDIAGLMARWLPDASGADLDLAVDAAVVTTLLDDQFDSPLGSRPDEVARVCGELTAVIAPEGATGLRTPLSLALAHLWERLSHGASGEWLARARRHWVWYLDAYVKEARNRVDDDVPTPEKYFELRRRSGWVYAMMDLSEKALRFETSEQVRVWPEVRRMLEITADVVDTINDVHTVEKEESRGDWHNLVLVFEHERGWPRNRSLSEITGMTCSWCAEFEERAVRLVDLGNGFAAVTGRLVDCMRDAMSGYLAWSRTARRYSHLVPPDEPAYRTTLV